MPLEHRLGHDPDRGLDGRAVVVGEDLEQRRPDRREGRVVVEAGRAVAPDRGELRGHQPVVGLGQGRVPVAREAAERRAGRLHDDEVLDAGLDQSCRRASRRPSRPGSPRRPARTRPRRGTPSTSIGRQPCSRTLTVARSTCGVLEEVLGERRSRTPRSSPSRCVLGERVGRVLHRVGGDDVARCRRRCGRPRSRPRARSRPSGRAAGAASGRARPGRGGSPPCRSGSAASSIIALPPSCSRSVWHAGRARCR